MIRVLSEPFVRFLVLGTIIFYLYSISDNSSSPPNETLVIDAAFVQSITDIWQAKRMRPPTLTELKSEIYNRVRQIILYREGLVYRLDQDDIVIQRRVAQKMDFLAAEIAGVNQITPPELRAYYQEQPSHFRSNSRVSFEHILFADAKNGVSPQDAAMSFFSQIKANSLSFNEVRNSGDITLLPQQPQMIDAQQLIRQFGNDFATALLPNDDSSKSAIGLIAPVKSDYGWHLVNITERIPAELIPFEQVELVVRRELERKRTDEAKEQFFLLIRNNYHIRLEGVDIKALDFKGFSLGNTE